MRRPPYVRQRRHTCWESLLLLFATPDQIGEMTMKKLAVLMVFFGVLLVPFVLSTPAQAQASPDLGSGRR